MKRRVLILIILMPFLLELASYLLFNQGPLFYKRPEDVEINIPLYATLDPLLGYTFDPFYSVDKDLKRKKYYASPLSDEKNLGNGFIKTEFKNETNPIRIAIIGSSTSDPNILNGNWPRKLHQLMQEKGISHVIYNGSVSGYNSTQQLIKLIRDVFSLGPIDIVISYGIGNDRPANEDSLENYPSIHPYQATLFNKILGNIDFYQSSGWFPNANFLFKKISQATFAKNRFLQLGVQNKEFLNVLDKNTQYMNEISKINKAQFLLVVEPFPTESNQIKEVQNLNETKLRESLNDIQNYVSSVEKLLVNRNEVLNLSRKLNSKTAYFIDEGHIDDDGNKIVAEEVQKEIENRFSVKQIKK